MKVRTLVLAGRRAGGDAMADASGLRHRALLPIAGVPMLERVVEALEGSGVAAAIAVCSDDAGLVEGTPALAALASAGRLVFTPASTSPASSVAAYFEQACRTEPLLVTTADHPLLTPQIVRHFAERAAASTADCVVGLVPASVYRARFPDQPRTFIPLRGEKYSGANLFFLRTPAAAAVPRFWVRVEAHRKTPWKLVRQFGLVTLALFAAGALDLRAAMARASRVVGARVDVVELPFAEAALDVDKEADRVAVEAVFAERNVP